MRDENGALQAFTASCIDQLMYESRVVSLGRGKLWSWIFSKYNVPWYRGREIYVGTITFEKGG